MKLVSITAFVRRYILKNAVRDWSKEGAAERAQSYDRICSEVKRWLDSEPRREYDVLVPGCGLGRLPFMLASQGYCTEVSLPFLARPGRTLSRV